MAYGEIIPPTGTIKDTWDDTNRILSNLSDSLSTVASLATSSVWGNVALGRVQQWVRNGTAKQYLEVGDQLQVPYTWQGTTYNWVLDVWHHVDGSDDSHPKTTIMNSAGQEETRSGMFLGSHYASPMQVPMNSQEAFMIPRKEMPAGAYQFTVKVNYVWGSGFAKTAGSRTYSFTLKNSISSANTGNYMFVWNGGYANQITKVSVYSSWNSSTPIETCAVTEQASGTNLGTCSELFASSDWAQFNNIQRACYGSNNWQYSSGRSWLNSDDAVWHDSKVTTFHRISSLDGQPGFLTGFDDSFKSIIVQQKNVTVPHPIDTNNAYGTSTTYDRVWLPSAIQHNFNNYLSNTEDGVKAEGFSLDYWKNLATYNDHGTWQGWETYGELRTYALGNKAQSRHVFFRSATRWGRSASYFGIVNSCGTVSGGYASGGACVQPAFTIA